MEISLQRDGVTLQNFIVQSLHNKKYSAQVNIITDVLISAAQHVDLGSVLFHEIPEDHDVQH